jgi:hypothetical protein
MDRDKMSNLMVTSFKQSPVLKGHIFSSPCQRQRELLPSLGVRRPLTFHILIFSSETPHTPTVQTQGVSLSCCTTHVVMVFFFGICQDVTEYFLLYPVPVI